MDKLTDAHVAKNFEMQLSGYYTDRQCNERKGLYYRSDRIPSTSWNHGFGLNPALSSDYEFARKNAADRGIDLAFFIREADFDALEELDKPFVLDRERWMMCDRESLNCLAVKQGAIFQTTSDSCPSDDYFHVLGNLFEDQAYNDRFRNFYIPTLMEAKLNRNVNVRHSVLYVNSEPVSCGSVYISGIYSGLYNVGTKFGYGGRGFGELISHQLTTLALDTGAESVFLQCVIGTHVEKLYGKLGYRSEECPGIVTFD